MHELFEFSTLATIIYYIIGCNGLLSVCSKDGKGHVFQLNLSDILVFGTGAKVEPIMGFQPPLTIAFKDEGPFASANTCINTIYLPRQPMEYSEFVYNVVFGITNSAGFGQL